MTEHLSEEQTRCYWERKLPPVVLLAIDDHVAVCAACRHRLGSGPPEETGTIARRLDRLSSTVARWRADLQTSRADPGHLTYEQLSGWVDGILDDADHDVVRSHLDECRSCAAELEDLREFAELTRTGSADARGTGSAGGAWWARFAATPSWTLRPFAGAAIAVFVVVTASTAGFVLWRTRESRSKSAEAAAARASVPAAPPAATPEPGSHESQLISLNIGGGRTLAMTMQGQVTGLDQYPAAVRGVVESTVRTGRLATPPILATLIARPRTVRDGSSAPAPFDLLGPAGTVILTDTPRFRWQPWTGATAYTVHVVDADQEEVSQSPLLPGTEWTAGNPLPRGRTYIWRVTAIGHGEEHTAASASGRLAKFHVLEPVRVAELSRARAQYGDSPLIMGALYAQAGLLDDAQIQFETLARAIRQSSPAARVLTEKLLADLQALRTPDETRR